MQVGAAPQLQRLGRRHHAGPVRRRPGRAPETTWRPPFPFPVNRPRANSAPAVARLNRRARLAAADGAG